MTSLRRKPESEVKKCRIALNKYRKCLTDNSYNHNQVRNSIQMSLRETSN